MRKPIAATWAFLSQLIRVIQTEIQMNQTTPTITPGVRISFPNGTERLQHTAGIGNPEARGACASDAAMRVCDMWTVRAREEARGEEMCADRFE